MASSYEGEPRDEPRPRSLWYRLELPDPAWVARTSGDVGQARQSTERHALKVAA